MIGKLKGIIDEILEDSFILDVSGVGYNIFITKKTIPKLNPGEAISIFIETHVREELIHLYGFLSREEKDTFIKLIQVSGVGTRVGIAILSHLTPSEVADALFSGDKNAFKIVPGIGTKLAERIILELKDKNISTSLQTNEKTNNSEVVTDAISALINLGINRNEANTKVRNIIKDNPNITLDEIIRISLKRGG